MWVNLFFNIIIILGDLSIFQVFWSYTKMLTCMKNKKSYYLLFMYENFLFYLQPFWYLTTTYITWYLVWYVQLRGDYD